MNIKPNVRLWYTVLHTLIPTNVIQSVLGDVKLENIANYIIKVM